ncbi:MAG: hypothetical protein AAB839_00070 [Patescibacteria group bacterium]
MALEATHVRFALALRSKLGIQDLVAYCSGAVYPDTRYVTGIDRAVTHGPDCPHDPFVEGLTDFERGWASHLLYDRYEGERIRELMMPSVGSVERSTRAWIEMSAMKVVEDMLSVPKMGEDFQHLRSLALDVAPRGENIDLIRRHFSITADLYGSECALDDYMTWIREVGADEEITTAMRNRVEEILKDEVLRRKIEAIFDGVVKKAFDA